MLYWTALSWLHVLGCFFGCGFRSNLTVLALQVTPSVNWQKPVTCTNWPLEGARVESREEVVRAVSPAPLEASLLTTVRRNLEGFVLGFIIEITLEISLYVLSYVKLRGIDSKFKLNSDKLISGGSSNVRRSWRKFNTFVKKTYLYRDHLDPLSVMLMCLWIFTVRKRSLGQGNFFHRYVSFCSQGGEVSVWCHFLSDCLVPCSFWGSP